MALSKEACAVAAAVVAPFLEATVNLGNADKRRMASLETPHELHGHADEAAGDSAHGIHNVHEVKDVECECCGMSEECTTAYIGAVRGRFAGRWVCGLCAEAVEEEKEKKGSAREEALRAHMGVCKRFNGFGRTHPVLFQAEAMREMLKSKSGVSRREAKEGVKKAAAPLPAALAAA